MSIGLRFKISMLVNETDLLRKVQSFFGFGTLGINKNGTVDFMYATSIFEKKNE